MCREREHDAQINRLILIMEDVPGLPRWVRFTQKARQLLAFTGADGQCVYIYIYIYTKS